MRKDKHFINTPFGRIALQLIHYSCQVWQSRVLVQVVQKGQHASSSFLHHCWGVFLMAFLLYQVCRWDPTILSQNQGRDDGVVKGRLIIDTLWGQRQASLLASSGSCQCHARYAYATATCNQGLLVQATCWASCSSMEPLSVIAAGPTF